MNIIHLRRKALKNFLNGRTFVFLPDDRYVQKISPTRNFSYLLFLDGDFIFIVHEAQYEPPLDVEKHIITMDPDSVLKKMIGNNEIFSMHGDVGGIRTSILDVSPAFRKPFDDEIPLIKEGMKKMVKSFNDSIPEISIGAKENDIRAEIDYRLIKNGFDYFIFPTVVASGIRSSIPLTRTSEKRIEKGDVIQIDISASYKGYEISLARVVFTEMDDFLKDIWDYYNGVFNISSNHFYQGEYCSKIDSLAREYLHRRGYSYPHYTGYPAAGFSTPYIFPDSEDRLERNSIFVFSPGMYIKGKYGFRIKRTVLIGDHGFIAIDE